MKLQEKSIVSLKHKERGADCHYFNSVNLYKVKKTITYRIYVI
jgi:hypothetical protein